MPGSKNLRVVVFCLGFETVKVLKPLEYYKADRAYMLCMTKAEGYNAFRKEIERQLKGKLMEYIAIETTVYKFADCLKELYKILHTEKEGGNHVYVNIFGTPAYSAAAMVACMMEDAVPFFAGTKEYTIPDPKEYYVGGRPMGISREVYPPMELPIFSVNPPPKNLVRALLVFREKKEKKHSTTYKAMIDALEPLDLMERKEDMKGKKKPKNKVQSDKMFYRRHYIDKWIKRGWVEEDKDGGLGLTDAGVMVTEVFGG
ncbi:MAG: hypothetical protein JSW00_06970 [Thermoplasmata archaeon]|nr:MAG: hypothetical protein JSW00_06970 [Thermoplasmata archaeon]